MSGIEVPDLIGKVRLDTSGLDAAVGEATQKGSLIGGAIGGAVGQLAAAGIGKALDALGALTTGAYAAAEESRKIGQGTDAIIRATGAAAGVTSEQVGDLATKLSNLTGVDDELIQSSSNLILTFKNVKNAGEGQAAVFDRANSAALDLAAAGFGSVDSAALQLGKALNDPVKGMAALSKSGVTFTAEQKEQIKTLTERGDLLAAQQVILAEVEAQVGGVAAATAAPLDRAKVAIGNMQEALGTLLLPVVDRVATLFVDKAVPAIDRFFGIVTVGARQIITDLAPVGDALRGVLGVLVDGDFKGDLFTSLGLSEDSRAVDVLFTVREGVLGVAGAVELLLTGNFDGGLFAGLGLSEDSAALDGLFTLREGLVDLAATALPAVAAAGASLSGLGPALAGASAAVGAALLPVFGQVGDLITGTVLPAVGGLYTIFYGQVVPAVASFAGVILTTVVPAVAGFVAQVAGAVLPIVRSLADFFLGSVVPAVMRFVAAVLGAASSAAPFVAFIVRVAGLLVELAGNILGPVVGAILRLAGPVIGAVLGALGGLIGIVGNVLGAIGRFGNALLDSGSKAGAFRDAIREKLGQAIDFVQGIPGRIVTALGNLGSRLTSAGSDLLQGLIVGIRNKVSGAVDAVKDAVGSVITGAKNKLGIASPSKVFIEIGQFITSGLIEGLLGTLAQVKAMGDKIADTLTKGFAEKLGSADLGAEAAQTVMGQLSGITGQLQVVAAEREQVATDLEAAQKRVEAAVKIREDFAASVAAGAASLGKLTGFLPKDIDAGPGDFVQGLRDARRDVEEFSGTLMRLKDLGISDQVYRQLVEAGVEAGGEVATALEKGGRAAVDEVNMLTDLLGQEAEQLGLRTSGDLFDAGVAAADGLARGLASRQEALLNQAREIANRIAATIRDALQIRSPSRVTFGFGRDTVEGMRLGILASTGGAVAAAGALAAGVAAAASATGDPGSLVGVGVAALAGALGSGQRQAAAAAPAVGVRVFIGDQELKGMIRTEIDEDDAALAGLVGAR